MSRKPNHEVLAVKQQEALEQISKLYYASKESGTEWSIEEELGQSHAEILRQLDEQPRVVARIANERAIAHLEKFSAQAKPLAIKLSIVREAKSHMKAELSKEEKRIRSEIEDEWREKVRKAREECIRLNGNDMYFSPGYMGGEYIDRIEHQVWEVSQRLDEKYLGNFPETEHELVDQLEKLQAEARVYHPSVDLLVDKTLPVAAQAYAQKCFEEAVHTKNMYLSGVFG